MKKFIFIAEETWQPDLHMRCCVCDETLKGYGQWENMLMHYQTEHEKEWTFIITSGIETIWYDSADQIDEREFAVLEALDGGNII